LRKYLLSFSVLHTVNTGLNILFSFAQLLIFAHVLPAEAYSKIVALTAVGFFLKPFDQAIGRANFIALREGTVRRTHTAGRPEIAAFLYGQAGLLILASLLAPPCVEGGTHHYLRDALYTLFALFTNFWAFDLQTTAWSVDLRNQFVRTALLQRVTQFASLATLWLTRDFLLFTVLAVVTTAAFTIWAVRMMGVRSQAICLIPRSGDLSWAALVAHARLVWASLLTTVSELVVLNFAYALISAVFGVGAAIVMFDSIMKIVRLSMTGARTLAEIALPRHSRMAIEQDRHGSSRLFLLVLGLCLGATAIPALALAVAGPRVFGLLLGPNNVVPASASLVAALIVLISGLYQPVLFFLGFANAQREIKTLTLASIVGFGVFSLVVFSAGLGAQAVLWAYAAYFGAASLLATLLLARVEGYFPTLWVTRASTP